MQDLTADLSSRGLVATGKSLLSPLAQTQDSGFPKDLTWVPKASIRKVSID